MVLAHFVTLVPKIVNSAKTILELFTLIMLTNVFKSVLTVFMVILLITSANHATKDVLSVLLPLTNHAQLVVTLL